MKKLIFSITLLTVMATEIKAESLFESTWNTIKTTAQNSGNAVRTFFMGAPETTVEPETMPTGTTTKVMNPAMAERSQKAYDQQHPEETTAAPKTTK
jgi:hypothetical protein